MMGYPEEMSAQLVAKAQAMRMGQLGGNVTHDQRPLETLSGAVLRVNSATVSVQDFIARFHGHEPESGAEAASNAISAAPPYGVSLEKLFAAIDRLETSVNSLTKIG
jgi:hypothetical protein